MIYTAVTEAAALATGKPVDRLADHLIQDMLLNDEGGPTDARALLQRLATDYSENDLTEAE